MLGERGSAMALTTPACAFITARFDLSFGGSLSRDCIRSLREQRSQLAAQVTRWRSDGFLLLWGCGSEIGYYCEETYAWTVHVTGLHMVVPAEVLLQAGLHNNVLS
jgi:hypothetical protein